MIQTLSPEAAFAFVDAWIAEHLEFFDPVAWDNAEERRARHKAFAELSTYLCFRTWCGFEAPEKLHCFVAEIANSKAFLALLCGKPSEFLIFASALSYPAIVDALEPAVREALREMATEPAIETIERLPNRHLDYLFCRATVLGETEQNRRYIESVYELSILPQRLLAAYLSREDAYALTHCVFFATQFGQNLSLFRERPSLLPHTNEIDALICRSVFEQDMDLALELAATRMIVSDEASPALALCIGTALQLLRELGALPAAPGLRIENRDSFGDSFRNWVERYHTMIVMGFTLAFALGRKRKFGGEPANAAQLLQYGGVLSAAYNADIFNCCAHAAELLASGAQAIPGARFQMEPVERMLRRHLALLQSERDPGLLEDAMRLGNLTGAASTSEGMQSVNALVRVVLPELKQFLKQ